jgi:hypothetical protein
MCLSGGPKNRRGLNLVGAWLAMTQLAREEPRAHGHHLLLQPCFSGRVGGQSRSHPEPAISPSGVTTAVFVKHDDTCALSGQYQLYLSCHATKEPGTARNNVGVHIMD